MKKILALAFLCFSIASFSQDSFKSPYSATSDTVTNTGTAYLTVSCDSKYPTAIIVTTVTEISGTTAGTITLQGSLDGSTYVALTDSTTIPEITTKSPEDVTTAQNFRWVVQNIWPYLRISYTGAGTMSARFSASRLQIKD